MDLIEKYLGEAKQPSKAIIGKIIDFIDARHTGSGDALKYHKELKKKLGKGFSKTLLLHGDPDNPKVGYSKVRNKWLEMFQA